MFKREDDFVGWLRSRLAGVGRGLVLGIGDDAALVRPAPGRELILTSDWTIEDVHFRLKLHPPESVGHRALARALSDVAAMGGRPRWALVSVALSKRISTSWVKRFYGGLSRLARRSGVVVAGGDTSVVADKVAIDIAVAGDVARGQALRRSGARPGGAIFVSGRLGLSALGLKLLEAGVQPKEGPGRDALRVHLFPEPQLGLGEFLARRRLATAMMDVSDGLSTDLARLCQASGVGARVWEMLLPIPTATVPGKVGELSGLPSRPARGGRAEPSPTTAAGAERSSAVALTVATSDPLALALHGGEDYQLLFTVSPRAAKKLPAQLCGVALHPIGVIDPGNTVHLVRASGKVEPLKPAGFDHFRKFRE